jgi:ABC-2 type transport system ATP-binding protein
LGELEKIATHYGIIRGGRMVQELTAKEMESRARVFVSFKVNDSDKAISILKKKYNNVREEQEYVRVYDEEDVDGIVKYLLDNNIIPSEIKKNKVGLEEYYIELMSNKEVE